MHEQVALFHVGVATGHETGLLHIHEQVTAFHDGADVGHELG